MPSPIAHVTIGYVVYRIDAVRQPPGPATRIGLFPRRWLATAGLSLLPDLDAIPGVLLGDMERFHNNAAHSLTFGLLAAIFVGLIARARGDASFARWFGIAFSCYSLHILLDAFTYGRGVMILWPFSLHRYKAPVTLFYGVRWSEGLFSIQHLWTIATETVFALGVGGLVHRLLSRHARPSPA